jgi:hypothetical protein
MRRILQLGPRHAFFLFLAVCVGLWGLLRYLRPTLFGRELLSLSPLYKGLPTDAYSFGSRPSWTLPLDTNDTTRPLVLRIAVISHAAEFDRRTAIRDTVFEGVSGRDVVFQHKFFLANTGGQRLHTWRPETVEQLVTAEQARYGDISILEALEGPNILGMKRHMALSWVNLFLPMSTRMTCSRL